MLVIELNQPKQSLFPFTVFLVKTIGADKWQQFSLPYTQYG
jgi:hypothetical protein